MALWNAEQCLHFRLPGDSEGRKRAAESLVPGRQQDVPDLPTSPPVFEQVVANGILHRIVDAKASQELQRAAVLFFQTLEEY